MLNVDIIDTDRLAASQILCKNPSNEDSEISLYAPYMAKINSEGNGEYVIYHPRLAWETSGHSMGSKVVPALRMAVEDVYIFTGDTAPTKYTALIQAFNETGALISALTTKGWVVPVNTAVSFVEIAIAVDSSGNPITTETAAAKTTLFGSSADLASTKTHYYRIQVDTSFGTYSDYNNCMTTDTSKNTFTSNLVKGKTYYSPSYQTRKGFVPANSDSGTDFDTSKDVYCRKSYTMDSNGVISIDTIYWQ
jgi:hypothetical protein